MYPAAIATTLQQKKQFGEGCGSVGTVPYKQ